MIFTTNYHKSSHPRYELKINDLKSIVINCDIIFIHNKIILDKSPHFYNIFINDINYDCKNFLIKSSKLNLIKNFCARIYEIDNHDCIFINNKIRKIFYYKRIIKQIEIQNSYIFSFC